MLEEFYHEVACLLEEAEQAILDIDSTGDFQASYNKVFRAFHSIKGAAGMFEFQNLQSHFHLLENFWEAQKDKQTVPEDIIDYFLKGIDVSKRILNGDEVDYPPYGEAKKNNKKLDIELAPATHAEDRSQATKATKPQSSSKDVHILVVNDEEDICECIHDILVDTENYKIKTLTDNPSALDYIKENHQPIDLIFSDLKMPNFDGLTLISEVHKIRPFLPIILVSSHLNADIIIDALSKGASGSINKPFDPEVILNMVDHNIKKYKTFKVLKLSIDCLFYQYNDIDRYLSEKGLDSIRTSMKSQIKDILSQFNELKNAS